MKVFSSQIRRGFRKFLSSGGVVITLGTGGYVWIEAYGDKAVRIVEEVLLLIPHRRISRHLWIIKRKIIDRRAAVKIGAKIARDVPCFLILDYSSPDKEDVDIAQEEGSWIEGKIIEMLILCPKREESLPKE